MLGFAYIAVVRSRHAIALPLQAVAATATTATTAPPPLPVALWLAPALGSGGPAGLVGDVIGG
jgi:hypothetical protein